MLKKHGLTLIAFWSSLSEKCSSDSSVLNLSVSCVSTVVSEWSCPISSGIMRAGLMRLLSMCFAILARVWSQTRQTIWSGVSPPPPLAVRGCTSTIVWIKVTVSLFCKKEKIFELHFLFTLLRYLLIIVSIVDLAIDSSLLEAKRLLNCQLLTELSFYDI